MTVTRTEPTFSAYVHACDGTHFLHISQTREECIAALMAWGDNRLTPRGDMAWVDAYGGSCYIEENPPDKHFPTGVIQEGTNLEALKALCALAVKHWSMYGKWRSKKSWLLETVSEEEYGKDTFVRDAVDSAYGALLRDVQFLVPPGYTFSRTGKVLAIVEEDT